MNKCLGCIYSVSLFIGIFSFTYLYFYVSTKLNLRHRPSFKTPGKNPSLLSVFNAGHHIKEIDIPSYEMDLKLMKAVEKLIRRDRIDLKPVNLEKFRYMVRPNGPCDFHSASSNFSRVLVLVKSAPDHYRLRQWLRLLMNETVGQMAGNLRMFFLLGYSKEMNIDINAESKKYGDIIQKNFIDTYRNLTYKTQMAFEWATTDCASVDFVLFQDDDFFANIKNVFEFLSVQLKPEELFTGFLVEKGSSVVRDRTSKWFVSDISFSNEVFPAYFPGGSYIASYKIVERLSYAFPYVKFIPVDDVYVGLVASKLGLAMKASHLFYFSDCDNWHSCLACKAFT